MAQVRTVCFDLDGVICSITDGDYEAAQPHQEAIDTINRLYSLGFRIIIHTSRFMARSKQDAVEANRIGFDFTAKQLAGWGVQYHELFLGKPIYDVVIDDRSAFYRPDWPAIREWILKPR